MKICQLLPPSPLPRRFAPKDTETFWIIKFWFQCLARAAGSMLCLGLYSHKMVSKNCALGGFCQEVTVFYWSAWTRGKPGSTCHTERQVRVCHWALSLVPEKGASSAWGPLLDGWELGSGIHSGRRGNGDAQTQLALRASRPRGVTSGSKAWD